MSLLLQELIPEYYQEIALPIALDTLEVHYSLPPRLQSWPVEHI